MNVVETLSILALLSFATLAFGQEKQPQPPTNAVTSQIQQIDQAFRFINKLENNGLIDQSLRNSLRTTLVVNPTTTASRPCIPVANCELLGLVCCNCAGSVCMSASQCATFCGP